MRSRFNVVASRTTTIAKEGKDERVVAELKSLKIEMEASRVLLGHVDQLATFATKVESCDAALSDLLEHADTYPDQPAETASSHVPNRSRSAIAQLQDRLDFCEREIDSLHTTFALVGDDERALGERARVTEMWDDVADSARQQIASAQASAAKREASSRARPLLPSLPVRPPTVGRSSILRERSPAPISSDNPRSRTMSSSSSLKKPFIPTEPGKTRLRPARDRSPSKSSIRSVSGPASGTPSRPSGQSTFKIPPVPSRPPSRTSSRSVSVPINTPTSQYAAPTFSSRQRTTSTTGSLRGRTAPALPQTSAPPKRIRVQSTATTTSTVPRASSPTLSTVSNHSSSGSPAKINTRLSAMSPSTPRARARTESTPRKSVSSTHTHTMIPRPASVRQKKTYVANPKNRLDVAVGAVVNKLPADVTIEPVLDTWKDESGKYWIGDAEPKLCFCRILRSQTVMVRVGGGWMELSK